MKILMLFPYAPLPPPHDLAGTKRNLPFLLELAKSNEVSVLSFGSESQRALFIRQYGTVVDTVRFVDTRRTRWRNGIERLWLMSTFRSPYRQLYRAQLQQALDEMVRETPFDVIHCCVPMFGYYRFPSGPCVTSDTHEVKFDLLRKTAQFEKSIISKSLNLWASFLGKREEPSLWKRFDAITVTTAIDQQRMTAIEPSLEPFVVENGAGDDFFAEGSAEVEPRSLVFTGLFTHLPNVQAVEYFLDRIFPLILARAPDTTFYVVGKAPPQSLLRRASDRVVITGFVEDVRPYIHKAELFVIPLLSGGGIRGKALEAMAMSKAIVSTTVGVEGIDLRHGESVMLADKPEEFAEAVLYLFNKPEARTRLGITAQRVAKARYTWAARGEALNQVLHRAVAQRRRAG